MTNISITSFYNKISAFTVNIQTIIPENGVRTRNTKANMLAKWGHVKGQIYRKMGSGWGKQGTIHIEKSQYIKQLSRVR